MKKKTINKILSLFLAFGLLSGFTSCGRQESGATEEYSYPLIKGEFENPAVEKLTIDGIDISEFSIVYGAERKIPAEKTAAEELATYLKLTVGIELPLNDDSTAEREHEILIGHTNRSDGIDRKGLGDDGFVIKSGNGDLIITGEGKRGTIYGVYEFLEKYLGWRFLTGTYETVYPEKRIELAALDDRQVPKFSYRDVYSETYHDSGLSVKRKLDSGYSRWIDEEYGGTIRYSGQPCHTMFLFTDTTVYGSQPCLSDPEVLQAAIGFVHEMMEADPGARIVSISQNDNIQYCTCEKCAAVDAEEESHAGTMIRFVNAVADAVKDEYPELMIQTFAYQYSRKPPKLTKPRDNVIIELCSIERCNIHSLDCPECEKNAEFLADLKGWQAISDHILLWDYYENSGNPLAEVPNFRTLRRDIRMLSEESLYGEFALAGGCEYGFGVLRNYLISKLLWDPDVTEEEYEEMIRDFMRCYYGKGWEVVYDYLNYYVSCGENKEEAGIWSNWDEFMTSGEILNRGEEFKEEFRKAKEDEENETLKSHLRNTELHFLAYYLTAEIGVIYEEIGTDEFQPLYDAWAEENEQTVRDIFATGVEIRETDPPKQYKNEYKFEAPLLIK